MIAYRKRHRFKLYLHNQGNAALRLSIQGTDPDHRRSGFNCLPPRFNLAPGERQTLIGIHHTAAAASVWAGPRT